MGTRPAVRCSESAGSPRPTPCCLSTQRFQRPQADVHASPFELSRARGLAKPAMASAHLTTALHHDVQGSLLGELMVLLLEVARPHWVGEPWLVCGSVRMAPKQTKKRASLRDPKGGAHVRVGSPCAWHCMRSLSRDPTPVVVCRCAPGLRGRPNGAVVVARLRWSEKHLRLTNECP